MGKETDALLEVDDKLPWMQSGKDRRLQVVWKMWALVIEQNTHSNMKVIVHRVVGSIVVAAESLGCTACPVLNTINHSYLSILIVIHNLDH